MAQGYVKAADLPQVIPVFPLPGAILLPRGQLPLNIFEPRYLNMVDDAMAGDRIIGMLQPQVGARRRSTTSAWTATACWTPCGPIWRRAASISTGTRPRRRRPKP